MEGPKGREQPPAVPAPPGQNRNPPGGWVGGTAQRPPAASGGGDSPLLRSPPRCHPREGRTPTRPQVAPVSRGGVVGGGEGGGRCGRSLPRSPAPPRRNFPSAPGVRREPRGRSRGLGS